MSRLPPIATIADVVEALRLLGVGVGVEESVPGVKVGLAYSAVGAAERNALATEQHARADGAGPAQFGEQVGAVLDGAACRSDLEVLALLEWPERRDLPCDVNERERLGDVVFAGDRSGSGAAVLIV